ncbi:MAG: hypothetical protein M3450_14020 [Actinomycetota bacterium]|nr:hypothetical protein [Actinomycetota bacterium]
MVDANSVLSYLSPCVAQTPGPLAVEGLDSARSELFHSLPETLQEALRSWNGAFFTDNLWFSTGVENRRNGAPPVVGDDALVELWGFHPDRTGPEADAVPHDLLEEAARHDGEAFLPRGLVAIGLGIHNSLVLVSVRPADRGAVYYWDWYWQYPWHIEFFQERIQRALERFADAPGAVDDPDHPDHDAAVDAANGATVVRLHDDFGGWVLAMRPETEP